MKWHICTLFWTCTKRPSYWIHSTILRITLLGMILLSYWIYIFNPFELYKVTYNLCWHEKRNRSIFFPYKSLIKWDKILPQMSKPLKAISVTSLFSYSPIIFLYLTVVPFSEKVKLNKRMGFFEWFTESNSYWVKRRYSLTN